MRFQRQGQTEPRVVRFRTVPAHQAPGFMESLHARFQDELARDHVEPLILIAAYVLDFLCIHPFLDGNGRMARLLSLLLLYQAGFTAGRYISLEKIVEGTRESYCSTLLASSQGWHSGSHDLSSWMEYILGVVVLRAHRELEERTGELSMARGAKSKMVESAIQRLPNRFRHADLARECPGISRPTIRRVLETLRQEGRIECPNLAPKAMWTKL